MASLLRLLILLFMTTFSYQQQQQSRLIFIQQLFRNGARYPQHILNIGDQFLQQKLLKGELTNEGRAQIQLLGRMMYHKYWKKLFSGTKYDKNDYQSRFLIKSSNVNRTIESAQSHIYGILQQLPPLEISEKQVKFSSPPYPGVVVQPGLAFGNKGKKYHPLAVHVQRVHSHPLFIGDILPSFIDHTCPNHQKQLKDNSTFPTINQALLGPIFNNAMRQLSLALSDNPNLVNLSNFNRYYDGLICLQSLGRNVPELIQKPSQTKRVLQYIYSINGNIAFGLNKSQVEIAATPFFKETITNIEKAISDEKAPQWVIYSGQDSTLAIIMAALRLSSVDCIQKNFLKDIIDPEDCITTYPKFAALLVFEVYENSYDNVSNNSIDDPQHEKQKRTLNKVYTIKINYNGQYKKIPFCGNLYYCQLRVFSDWINTWAVTDFLKNSCGVDKRFILSEQFQYFRIVSAFPVVIWIIWSFLLGNKIKQSIYFNIRSLLSYIGVKRYDIKQQ